MARVRLVARLDWAPGLATFRLSEAPAFEAGQFFNLGLISVDGEPHRRSYSAASAPGAELEFLLTEVPGGALTPGLFQLGIGDELELDLKAQGFFTLRYVPQAQCAWLLATGTGLGPFVSMLRSRELWSHFEQVILVHGVREQRHLAYASELSGYELSHPGRFRYLACVSREPALTGQLSGRLPAAIQDGRLEALAGAAFSSAHQVLLCGNPEMITDAQSALVQKGLRKHRVRKPGQISFEKYW